MEAVLSAPPWPPYGGRHRTVSDRACLAAIVYMARLTGPVLLGLTLLAIRARVKR